MTLRKRYGFPGGAAGTRSKPAGSEGRRTDFHRARRGYEGDNSFTIPEHPAQGPSLELNALVRKADPGYFSTLEIPLISGRVFNEQDKLGRTHHVVISKKFSDQFFPSEDPVGKHVKIAFSGNTPDVYEVIGVVGNTIHEIGQPIKATIYRSILNGDPMLDSVARLRCVRPWNR
jgi:hypothetical protein